MFKSNSLVVLTTLKQLTCNAVLVTLNSPSWGWARASLLIHEQLLNLIPGTIHDVGKIIEAGFRVITQFLVPNLLFSAVRTARWQRQIVESRALEAISDIESANAARALLDAEQVSSSNTILRSVIFLNIPLLRCWRVF